MRNVLGVSRPRAAAGDEAMTVAQLTAQLRAQLETGFPSVRVKGEISNWTVASSGHAYFNLKDANALLPCVMWRSSLASVKTTPRDGMMAECAGSISVFEKRGQYQLIATRLSAAGEGELWRRFQELKAKLEAEGLFAPERKRAIPPLPRCVGVVSSPTGAVIHDIGQVLGRRAPWLPVLLWPARVQGEGADAEIARGIEGLGKSGRVDVIIVARGGGSMEDLWEFNSEAVVRAVVASSVPVISGVGHETDFTLCDFAADLRAPTPSAAAEIVSAGHLEVGTRVVNSVRRLERALGSRMREARMRLEGLLRSRGLHDPESRLRRAQQRLDLAMQRLPESLDRLLDLRRRRLERSLAALNGHNPESILGKGYAIVRRASDGRILKQPRDARPGSHVLAQLAGGEVRAIVTKPGADLFE